MKPIAPLVALSATLVSTSMVVASLASSASAAPYIGVTVGFAGNDLNGPYMEPNAPLYNPVSGQTVPTWDDWVEEATAAGVDYMAPDQRGYMPVSNSGDPHRMADLVNVLKARGVDGRLRVRCPTLQLFVQPQLSL